MSNEDLKIRVERQFFINWANISLVLAPYLHTHWMPACEYGANTGIMYMDYCKISPCGTIIGNQGGRQDVSEEALGEEKAEKVRATHHS